MKTLICSILMLILLIPDTFSQNSFRSGIFLHHSTGGYIWGPNPDGTSTKTIPGEMNRYNQEHGYSGINAVSMEEEWWSPGDNEWSTQHEFFEGNTAYTDINHYLSNYKILVVKSCFPSSAIESWGQPSDTNYPEYKSVYNYKWHWRHIVQVMKEHPQNFFAIWTNAPLEIHSTNASEAAFSKLFCRWAKDTLAEGLDPVFGPFPPNAFVFDYFGKMTDDNGYELPQFVMGAGDSHPNGAGTDFAAPRFVDEIFAAAIAYESMYNGTNEKNRSFAINCYPNPFSGHVNLVLIPEKTGSVIISIYNNLGILIYNTETHLIQGKTKTHTIDLSSCSAGIYYYKISESNNTWSGKMIRK